MHKLLFVVIFFLLSSAVIAQGCPDVVRIAVHENPPKIYTDENGMETGLHIELLRAIAQEEGWDLDFVHGTWDESLERVRTGDVDILPDIGYTP